MMHCTYTNEISVANLFTQFEWKSYHNATRKRMFMKPFNHQQTFNTIIILLNHSSIFHCAMCTCSKCVIVPKLTMWKKDIQNITVHKNNVLDSLTLWLKIANYKYETQVFPSAGNTNRNTSTLIQKTAVAGGCLFYLKLLQNHGW